MDLDWKFNFLAKEVYRSIKESETQSWTIFRVPPKLFNVQKSAFHPEKFLIGLFYATYPEEYKIYDLKMRHLRLPFGGQVGEISGSSKIDEVVNTVRLEEVYKATQELMMKIKECHSETVYIREVYLVINGCFVVEWLRSYNKLINDDHHHQETQLDASGGSSDSPILAARWLIPHLLRDLIKLQNQLPFFVLETIFLNTKSDNAEPSLANLFAAFFCSMLSLKESIYMPGPIHTRHYAHPLELLRALFVFPIMHQRYQVEGHPKLIYSAQELQEVGITFTKKENANLLDISFDFHRGVLQIPPLCIDENMTVALLNFVAYEQCDHSQKPFFTNYLIFLDSLINTTNDVEILCKNGIIRYPLGTEKELVNLFNNFCKEMMYPFNQTYLSVDMNDVNNYCKAYYDSKWRTWWSDLKKGRFSSPWSHFWQQSFC